MNYQSNSIQTTDQINNIFTKGFHVTTNNDHMHSPINLAKLSIFYDLSFEGSKVCQNGELCQLQLMVMSSPHTLDKIHWQLQTKVPRIRVFPLESSSISVISGKKSFFESYQVDHAWYHDWVVDWLEGSYLMDFFVSR